MYRNYNSYISSEIVCVCFVFDSYGLHLTLEAPVQSLQGGAASKKPESWRKWLQIC